MSNIEGLNHYTCSFSINGWPLRHSSNRYSILDISAPSKKRLEPTQSTGGDSVGCHIVLFCKSQKPLFTVKSITNQKGDYGSLFSMYYISEALPVWPFSGQIDTASRCWPKNPTEILMVSGFTSCWYRFPYFLQTFYCIIFFLLAARFLRIMAVSLAILR